MRILVTGARGMVGRAVQRLLTPQHEIIATDLDELDVTMPGAALKYLEQTRPAAVLHLAALTDVDYCEVHHDEALRINTLGTELLAAACRRFDCDLLYVSTIAVFDGTADRAYTEYDQPHPANWYAHTKWLGEQAVAQLADRFYIVRTGWLFGGWPDDHKFIGKIMLQAQNVDRILAVNDKFGSPTYTDDLARGLQCVLESGLYGTYHLVNTGDPVSRYDTAQELLRLAQLNHCSVEPISSDRFPMPAPRPRMEAARNLRLELLGYQWMRAWQDALQDYIAVMQATPHVTRLHHHPQP